MVNRYLSDVISQLCSHCFFYLVPSLQNMKNIWKYGSGDAQSLIRLYNQKMALVIIITVLL